MRIKYISIYESKRDKHWYIMIPAKHTTTNQRLPIYCDPVSGLAFDSYNFAARVAIDIDLEIERGNLINPSLYRKKEGKEFQFRQFVRERYLPTVTNLVTNESYRLKLKSAVEFFGSTDIRKISPYDVERLKASLKGSSNYCRKRMVIFKAVMNSAHRWYGISVPEITLPKEERHLKVAVTDDMRRIILSRIPEWDMAIVKFIFYTGCRIGEALRLRWKDIQGNVAIIRKPKELHEKKIRLDLYGDLLGTLSKIPRGSDENFVFKTPDGFPYYYERVRRIIAKAREGITTVGTHVLGRSTLINMMLSDGYSLPDTMAQVGHSNIATTQRYLFETDVQKIQLRKVGRRER